MNFKSIPKYIKPSGKYKLQALVKYAFVEHKHILQETYISCHHTEMGF